MKKLLLSLTLVAFALTPALQAGEDCAKAKAACPEAAKVAAAKTCASACNGKKSTVARKIDAATKGATLLVKR